MCVAGKQVKACFGTTKYCNAFLKGIVCNNPECLYLHEIGMSVFCIWVMLEEFMLAHAS